MNTPGLLPSSTAHIDGCHYGLGRALIPIVVYKGLQNSRPRVLLADRDDATPTLVSSIIASRFEMIGTVYDGEAAVEMDAGLKPNVLVSDIILPKLNGFEVVRQLTALSPATKVVILTDVDEPDFIVEALQLGVSGFVLKRKVRMDLPLAINAVLEGKVFVSAQE